MRLPALGLLAVLASAMLFLSGCASPEAAATPADADGPDPADLTLGSASLPLMPMRFAGGGHEATLPIDLAWAAADVCPFTNGICPQSVREVDLTPLVPAQVPVELSLAVAGDGNYDLRLLAGEGVTLLRYVEDYGAGTYRIDATLVRSPEGTVGLWAQYYLPSLLSVVEASLRGQAHAVSRDEVVPAFVPVAVELGPGDAINATGDGLTQLVLIPPRGEALRAVQAPFELRVPEGYPAGTYVAVVDSEEAVRLLGPDRPLSARQLVFAQTAPVDLAAGAVASWSMPVQGHPLVLGVVVGTKVTVEGSAVAAFPGNLDVKLTSPRNVDVVAERQECLVLVSCGMALLGSYSYGFSTDLLDEHLVPGEYAVSVTTDGGRDMQAWSWSLTVG
jgi:hypothetical protein